MLIKGSEMGLFRVLTLRVIIHRNAGKRRKTALRGLEKHAGCSLNRLKMG